MLYFKGKNLFCIRLYKYDSRYICMILEVHQLIHYIHAIHIFAMYVAYYSHTHTIIDSLKICSWQKPCSPVHTTGSSSRAPQNWLDWRMSWSVQQSTSSLHPGRLTWNIIMEVWKIIFLSKWLISRFHVNLPGCKVPHSAWHVQILSNLLNQS